MTSRRFNKTKADEELEALRKSKPPILSPISSDDTKTATVIETAPTTKGALAARATAGASLYNVLLKDNFRPEDATPILSKDLAVQIKELRKLEAAALAEAEEIEGYQYTEEKALRDKLLGLDTVSQQPVQGFGGLLPPRKEMRDNATVGGEPATNPATTQSSSSGQREPLPLSGNGHNQQAGGVDEDGNMACGTDDLEAFIRSQQQVQSTGGDNDGRGLLPSSMRSASIKTVWEVPKGVVEMSLGAAIDELIEQLGAEADIVGMATSRPQSATAKPPLIVSTSTAREPILKVFQSTLTFPLLEEKALTPRQSDKPNKGASGFTPSPPRIGKRAPSSASSAVRPSNSAVAGVASAHMQQTFGRDLYSLNGPLASTTAPVAGGALGLLGSLRTSSSGGGVGGVARLAGTISGSAVPARGGSSTSSAVRSRLGIPSKRENTEPQQHQQQEIRPISSAPADINKQKLYVHTEYLGNNTIAFCPNCRHCVDISRLKQDQQETITERLRCPRCAELWVDKALLAEQRKIEEDESAEFQKAVLEWRRAAKKAKGGNGQTSLRDLTIDEAEAGGGAGGVGVGVGTTEALPAGRKRVKIPKSLYFLHLCKCLESVQGQHQ